MHSKRIQLTLFVPENESAEIEAIRRPYNPVQHELIAAHVTLCREDELTDLDQVLHNLGHLDFSSLRIRFGKPERFDDGKGVLLPVLEENTSFQELRKRILKDVIEQPRIHQPHITLMHPRNASCTDEIMAQIRKSGLPSAIQFDHISLIEQTNGGKWIKINSYQLR